MSDIEKVVTVNRKARYDYEILDEVEAGIILSGQEVKSVRAGNINLSGAYVSFLGGDIVLKNASIAPYAYASDLEGYDPGQDRKLLLKKEQGKKLRAYAEQKGVTVIPLEVRAGRFVKVLLGAGRGRKRYDKRHRIREKEVKRRLHRGQDA